MFNEAIDSNVRYQLVKRMESLDDAVELEDFQVLKKVRNSSFGNVYLCVHREEGTLYRLKSISR